MVLLHGLFGAGGNLGALGRHLSPENTVYAPDLPGHGRSHWSDSYTLPGMAAAIVGWMDAMAIDRPHVVGHSLGGKVAMQLALSSPERVASLVVADIAPVSYQGRHDAVFTALQDVAVAHCDSRAQAQRIMQNTLVEEGVIQFLLASLRRNPEGVYQWLFDRQGLQRDYPALLAAPQGDEPGDNPVDDETRQHTVSWPGPTLFIKGETSDYITADHLPAIARMFPDARVESMPHCGHWLHVEQPQVFNALVAAFQAAQ